MDRHPTAPQRARRGTGSPRARLHYRAADDRGIVRGRLAAAGLALAVVFTAATLGYHAMGRGQWSWLDCAYMVLITITTVGYGEILPFGTSQWGRGFTMGVVFFGIGVSAYFLSSLTAFFIEGDLREVLWRRKMGKRLAKLKGHYIVCGVGRTGVHVVDELLRAGRAVVVIESDRERLERMVEEHADAFFGILGDATDDGVLRDAGIAAALGLVTTLELDQDNLFVALSARQLSPKLRIISRASTERATAMLRQAGADAVINPTHIGGRRMAHELLHPNVVGFLDLMAHDHQQNLGIEEVAIPVDSPLAGRKLAQSRIREVSNVLVLSVLRDGEQIYNPPPDFELASGTTLIVLGEREQIERLARHAAGG